MFILYKIRSTYINNNYSFSHSLFLVVTEYLLVANREGIVRLELDGQRQEPLVRGEENTIAVDFDIRHENRRAVCVYAVCMHTVPLLAIVSHFEIATIYIYEVIQGICGASLAKVVTIMI